MNRSRAPLFEAMIEHHTRKASSFHVPGHKSGAQLDDEAGIFFKSIMNIDYTEITGLDDLHGPDGVIEDAQQLAAACFGAEHTYFLVNGSTVGNLAMIAAVCSTGDTLLVQRNVHKSVIHGLMLAGADAVFLSPMCDPVTGLVAGISIDDVEEALERYPYAKGLLLTNPNYYGIGINLKPIADIVHRQGKVLLVDEAHGAHYGFHPELPESALTAGADMVVQSTHKMLTALTMGAMLHVQGDRVDRWMTGRMLSMLQSSSPSYPIMASLDLARKQLHEQGVEMMERGLKAVRRFIDGMETCGPFQAISVLKPNQAVHTKDPFKVLIRDGSCRLNGFAIREKLERAGCYCEMADSEFVLLVFSACSTLDDSERLLAVFAGFCTELAGNKQELDERLPNIYTVTPVSPISQPVSFRLRMEQGKNRIRIPLSDAVHYKAAETVMPYPPGIPVLYTGETITKEMVDYLLKLARMGARFQGLVKEESLMITVIDERLSQS
jgi:arginine/lysine/ornithine decarboxylase